MIPVSSGIRFDAENSRCIPAERMMPDELRQLHRLAIERRPEACLGCGQHLECDHSAPFSDFTLQKVPLLGHCPVPPVRPQHAKRFLQPRRKVG